MQESKTEQKTHVIDGVTYVEVARKAKAGELVVIVNKDSELEPYENGDVLLVSSAGNVGICSNDKYVHTEEYRVLEPIAYPRDEVIETLIRKVDALEQRLAEAENGERQLFRLFARLDDITEDTHEKVEMVIDDIVALDERTRGLRTCR